MNSSDYVHTERIGYWNGINPFMELSYYRDGHINVYKEGVRQKQYKDQTFESAQELADILDLKRYERV